MLVIPMRTHRDEVIGVLQLINRKHSAEARLTSEEAVAREVIPFDQRSVDLVSALASQAAVAIENGRLYEDIERLFEGFVTAAVTAIESRDPTTSGHSSRVATFTCGLAEAVDRVGSGPYRALKFSREQMKEIRYAGLLHDFGKVGVREQVLIKAKKLYPWQADQIRSRFGVARAGLESRFLRRKLDYLLDHGPDGAHRALAAIDRELEQALAELEESYQLVRQANEPSVMAGEGGCDVEVLAGLGYPAADGGQDLLVQPRELRKLRIARGSLDAEERAEIESHVTHTYKFLTKIPWTHDLRRVPEIAWAHHEKLDGSGYPNRLTVDEIPMQSKMMAIADIFDALTAWDRPYKKAVPTYKALQILLWETNEGHLDPQLLDVFVKKGIYKLTARDDA
jgi:HD-GYP domain-containing protein (c-di-GMP phosphodiesterase class II)